MISEKNDFLSPQENLISRCEITIENAKKDNILSNTIALNIFCSLLIYSDLCSTSKGQETLLYFNNPYERV